MQRSNMTTMPTMPTDLRHQARSSASSRCARPVATHVASVLSYAPVARKLLCEFEAADEDEDEDDDLCARFSRMSICAGSASSNELKDDDDDLCALFSRMSICAGSANTRCARPVASHVASVLSYAPVARKLLCEFEAADEDEDDDLCARFSRMSICAGSVSSNKLKNDENDDEQEELIEVFSHMLLCPRSARSSKIESNREGGHVFDTSGLLTGSDPQANESPVLSSVPAEEVDDVSSNASYESMEEWSRKLEALFPRSTSTVDSSDAPTGSLDSNCIVSRDSDGSAGLQFDQEDDRVFDTSGLLTGSDPQANESPVLSSVPAEEVDDVSSNPLFQSKQSRLPNFRAEGVVCNDSYASTDAWFAKMEDLFPTKAAPTFRFNYAPTKLLDSCIEASKAEFKPDQDTDDDEDHTEEEECRFFQLHALYMMASSNSSFLCNASNDDTVIRYGNAIAIMPEFPINVKDTKLRLKDL